MVSTKHFNIVSLIRYAVKGLGPGDLLSSVHLDCGSTLPDDRRFALIRSSNIERFNPERPEWLHKENFLCAFTEPDLLVTFDSEYVIDGDRKLLSVWKRDADNNHRSRPPLLGPVDLSTSEGLEKASSFFSEVSRTSVKCVTAGETHQFGNTSSGWKQRQNTRTIHIVNTSTVDEFSQKIGVPLNPARFRPNIVMTGLDPWSEFDLVGKSVRCSNGVVLDVISKTVRCNGVSVDPYDLDRPPIDIPGLLAKNFPEYGPYLGVYAVVREGGMLR